MVAHIIFRHGTGVRSQESPLPVLNYRTGTSTNDSAARGFRPLHSSYHLKQVSFAL